MKISTKGRYALRLMIDLAESAQKQCSGFVALKDIAERQNISKKYLEQIVPPLLRGGLLRTNRGYQGGYMLTRSPGQYTVGDILRVTEGNMAPVACLQAEENTCGRQDVCPSLAVWQGLHRTILQYLDSITLQDIIDGKVSTENQPPV